MKMSEREGNAEGMQKMLAGLSIEQRLAGLAPEQVLATDSSEQVLLALPDAQARTAPGRRGEGARESANLHVNVKCLAAECDTWVPQRWRSPARWPQRSRVLALKWSSTRVATRRRCLKTGRS
ncbi:MAG: hypothetical protein ACMG6S_33965, partial [Byssovorax sp.]